MKSAALKQIKRFIAEEKGATAVEYGVLVALIIALCILVIGSVGTKVLNAFTSVDNAMP